MILTRGKDSETATRFGVQPKLKRGLRKVRACVESECGRMQRLARDLGEPRG